MGQSEILSLRIKCECGQIDNIDYDENDVEIVLDCGASFIYYSFKCGRCNQIIKTRIG